MTRQMMTVLVAMTLASSVLADDVRMKGAVRVDSRYAPAGCSRQPCEVGASQFVLGQTDQVERASGPLQVHGHALGHVVDLSHGTDKQ